MADHERSKRSEDRADNHQTTASPPSARVDGADFDGLEALRHIPSERILIIGFHVAETAPSLLASLPGADVVSLTEETKAAWPSLRSVRRGRYDAVIAVQNYRKLKLLALAARARNHFVIRHERIEPIRPLELALQLSQPARQMARRARDRLENLPAIPGPVGAGNDYSAIEATVPDIAGDWPRVTASVMVPVYNRKGVLAKTLAGLVLQTYPKHLFEVLIADDGSSDHPEELVERFGDRLDIRVVRQDDLGYRLAAVRNLAIGAARCDVIVSLDCDMLPEPDFLRAHLRWFHATSAPLMTIGHREFVDTEGLTPEAILGDFDAVRRLPRVPAPSAIRTPGRAARDWRLETYERSRMLRDHQAPYLFASGGNAAFWKRDARSAGLYHDGFDKWGGEDADFAHRLERLGAYFVPELTATAYHQDHPSPVVREDDKLITRDLLGRRVPRLRHYASVEVEAYEIPRVSVLIFDDGRGGDLASTVQSALRQRDQDLEVLILDANDEARRIAAEMAGAHPPIRCLAPVSGPWPVGMDHAVRSSRGEFVLPLPIGCHLARHAVRALAEPLQRAFRAALVYGAHEGQRADRPRRYSAFWHLHGDIVADPCMFRVRDYHRTGGFDPAAQSAARHDLTLKLAEVGDVFSVREVLARCEPPAPRPSAEDTARVVEAAMTRRKLDWEVDRHHPLRLTEPDDLLGRTLIRLREGTSARPR